MGKHFRGKLKLLAAVLEAEQDECIEFPWTPGGTGYGNIRYKGKSWKTHRLVCFLVHGEAPTPRHEVCHSCHNRRCWNKRHVRWDTHSNNMKDMHKRRPKVEVIIEDDPSLPATLVAKKLGLPAYVVQRYRKRKSE